eukprot:3373362-Amphidinium_carterae.1
MSYLQRPRRRRECNTCSEKLLAGTEDWETCKSIYLSRCQAAKMGVFDHSSRRDASMVWQRI